MTPIQGPGFERSIATSKYYNMGHQLHEDMQALQNIKQQGLWLQHKAFV